MTEFQCNIGQIAKVFQCEIQIPGTYFNRNNCFEYIF